MKLRSSHLLLGIALISSGSGATAAQAPASAQSLAGFVTQGSAGVDLRYRYEYVDQDNRPENAHSSTLRSRITLNSAEWSRISAGVELDYVSRLGAERYNTLSNGKIRYPVVPDADGFSLNQAWVRYRDEDLTATAGRQRILHGRQRFVGGVGWRQNEQTFDAARLQVSSVPNWQLDYAHVWDVSRIFGPDTGGAQPRRFDSDSHLIRAEYQAGGEHRVGLFGYLFDFDNAPGASSQTYGVDFSGPLGPLQLTAALARQSDYRDQPADYQSDYHLIEVSMPAGAAHVAVGREVLGSDNGVIGFATPLATLHKFNGWADVFLNTPAAGLKDTYLRVGGKAGPLKLAAIYHEYDADSSSADFGSEWNVSATLPVNSQWMAQLKFANYQAGDIGTDLAKAWLTIRFSY